MHKLRRSEQLPLRRGFTLIELLAVISIIAVLMSLLAPAVLNARSAARRLQCLNRIKNISLAMLGNEVANKRLPASGHFSATGPEQYHNWVVSVLPYLDRLDLFDRYQKDEPRDSADNKVVTNTYLEVLVCPEDISVVSGQGNLSYVVNGGFCWTIPVDCPVAMHTAPGTAPVVAPMDFNGDGIVCSFVPVTAPVSDKLLFKRTGLFFLENWPSGSGTVRHHRIDSITDGASNTLLIAENVRAGYDPGTGDNWGATEAHRNSFFVSSFVCAGGNCTPGNVDYGNANNHTAAPYSYEALNSSLTQGEGEAPWPSAYHHGQINVAFCDGRAQPISDAIDGAVYAALVSPQGDKITGALRQPLLSGNNF